MREISWTTKAIALVLIVGFLTGLLYIGYAVSSELRASRERVEKQAELIVRLEDQLSNASNQLGEIERTSREAIRLQSLAQTVRLDYGRGICLVVGIYQLVDRRSGKVLRYQDPGSSHGMPVSPSVSEGDSVPANPSFGLTTEGGGSPVEYDFIGTGFHVGGGYIVTNRHVIQPWTEDDLVKTMMRDNNGRARIKSLVVYFPNYAEPYRLTVRQTGGREDIAVATIDPTTLPADLPVIPLETDDDSVTVGKTVVTMGYPNGPDRLLAMVEDDEAKSINARFGGSRQNLINFLAQSKKIVPLTTQGAITDLDTRRIVHDAKTAEGGSGAPLFGQTGKVIGVNFGVFTENTAVNMAVPIRFAIDLLMQAGWQAPDQILSGNSQTTAATNSSTGNSPTTLTGPR
ncbi:serine protease [Leptolyngbya sp. 7M]|uniref:S1 family peptidase n=1 Tax=Leptolyngbya sp. 7M TaxID=2812896 RepID=UPI001B8C6EF3|nr:serine protease [Leptolyngbya sp. 7M]QYO64065.1 trypsin-like peptidase domain-containing protein [Leptolyngbya sp. 7M]